MHGKRQETYNFHRIWKREPNWLSHMVVSVIGATFHISLKLLFQLELGHPRDCTVLNTFCVWLAQW